MRCEFELRTCYDQGMMHDRLERRTSRTDPPTIRRKHRQRTTAAAELGSSTEFNTVGPAQRPPSIITSTRPFVICNVRAIVPVAQCMAGALLTRGTES